MLLLFDIDGTLLLRAFEAHRNALHAALREVHGIADPAAAHVEAAGRTDNEIARNIALLGGVTATRIDERAGDLREACCRIYAEICPDDLSSHLAPGVPELLERLAGREEMRLSLLTGNFEPVARIKLARAGIGHFFDSGQGAFGSDHEDRTELPAIARRRAGSGGRPFERKRTVVIGDTPRDIACARADGVHALAVATGLYSEAELADADGVTSSASELPALLERVGAFHGL